MIGIGVGHHRIFAVDVQAFDLSANGCAEYVGSVNSDFIAERNTPGVFEFLHHFGICNLLISRKVGGLRSHIAGALDIVLSAQRIDAAARPAQLAAEHRHIRHGHYALGTGGMFCNPETIDNRRLFSGSVHPRRFDELIFVDVTDLRHIFRRVFFYDFLQFLKTFGTLGDKFFVDQTFLYHHVASCRWQRHDIRSRLQFQMNIRVLRQTDISRIHDDKPRSVLYRLTDLHSHHRDELPQDWIPPAKCSLRRG